MNKYLEHIIRAVADAVHEKLSQDIREEITQAARSIIIDEVKCELSRRIEEAKCELSQKIEDDSREFRVWFNKRIHHEKHNLPYIQNLELAQHRIASASAAKFVYENFQQTTAFRNKFELISHCLTMRPAGLIAEFGVWKGDTINYIAEHVEEQVYGFDSFQGLPEKWRDGFEQGAFRMEKPPDVRDNVSLVQGWFSETLRPFLDSHEGKISFAHVDCDLYSSTIEVLNQLAGRFQDGSIIVFDEYINYPNWEQGEFRAFNEFISTTQFRFEYIGYCKYHEQVAVKLLLPVGPGDGGESWW